MEQLRIGLAQVNATVGDLEGNTRKILEYIGRARELGIDVGAFPELVIPGYPPEDLLLKASFIEANLACLKQIAAATKGMTEGRLLLDVDGHYSRPDVFHLEVNDQPQSNVTFKSQRE